MLGLVKAGMLYTDISTEGTPPSDVHCVHMCSLRTSTVYGAVHVTVYGTCVRYSCAVFIQYLYGTSTLMCTVLCTVQCTALCAVRQRQDIRKL